MAWLMMRVSIATLLTNFHLDLDPNVDCKAYWDRSEGQMKHRLRAKLTPIVTELERAEEGFISQADPGSRKFAANMELSTPTDTSTNTVVLPELFVSWASVSLRLHPNYLTVSKAADQWFKE